VRVHLGAFRIFLPDFLVRSNAECPGDSVSGIPVQLHASASLLEAGFDKPQAAADYLLTAKPAGLQFEPSEWYQFPSDAILTFPLSSVDKALDITIGAPLCNAILFDPRGAIHFEPQPLTIHIHRPRHTSDGRDLAGPFHLRSSPGNRAIEISGCIDVASAVPRLPHLPTGLFTPCQPGQLAPLIP
jgi:hypothetical protein